MNRDEFEKSEDFKQEIVCESGNFKCYIKNSGWWYFDKKFGKWLFFVEPKQNNFVAKLTDHEAFLKGILEVEERNDNHEVGRPKQKQKTIELLKEVIKEYEKNKDI